ncbi:N66 matrix protein-like isoform X6 [Spodoptera frugiperda]|uniref:N66 matrix protein-like isoform X4 n=1 Tax=Spodoptera frugiperda TaxID=7108 RepID=A0A9R0DXL9_SPOFR|nr:N66 matrix protein-like isoform X4 [Spodoptera frugiperda]XP_050555107.1 N66 matrix protein-like isoform X5 [Spodoptera frugiperda]XP_050555108.1 N66 matrix protein-like isoform X6 [Spodoptera frugiperda]
MVRLTVVIPFLFLVACVCTYPSKTPDNEELYDDRNNINNQSLRLRRQTYNYNNNGNGSIGQINNSSIKQHFGNINYGNNGTSKPTHIVNINGGVANGGASYGSGNGGHGGFNTLSGDKHQKMHVESGHEDKGGEGGKGGGQITTSEVVIAKNNNNPENRRETNNAISSSNGPINMSISNPASVARKPITGGGSEAGAMSINNSNGGDNGHEYTGGPKEDWVWQS